MRFIISLAALLLSIILLQLSSGAMGPLDALSALELNFTTQQIGMLGSAHFFGFFIGCWWAPRLMGSIGHSRAFAAFAALGAIGILMHMMIVNPYAWALMRVASGLCVAGCYTIIEAWLNAKTDNANRGRTMGTYRVADMGASMVAQLFIAILPPAEYVSYNLLAIFCCASLLPLTLSTAKQPATPSIQRLRPRLALLCSPLAVAGVMAAALTSASFRMVGPLYAEGVGLARDQIAYFMAAFVLGGALAQIPVGWIADKYDRRWVLIGLSVAAVIASGTTILAAGAGTTGIMLGSFFFGLVSFPIFSVSAAHANDFATSEQRVELSAALMFFYAMGAIAGPMVASGLIAAFGTWALFAFLALGHIALIAYSLARMSIRSTVEDRTPYVYTPRSSFTIGRLLGRMRDEKPRGSD